MCQLKAILEHLNTIVTLPATIEHNACNYLCSLEKFITQCMCRLATNNRVEFICTTGVFWPCATPCNFCAITKACLAANNALRNLWSCGGVFGYKPRLWNFVLACVRVLCINLTLLGRRSIQIYLNGIT